VREQGRATPEPRRGKSRLNAGVPAADHNHFVYISHY